MGAGNTILGIVGGVAANYALATGGRYVATGDLGATTKNAYYGAATGNAVSAVSGIAVKNKPGYKAMGITMTVTGAIGVLLNLTSVQAAPITSFPASNIFGVKKAWVQVNEMSRY